MVKTVSWKPFFFVWRGPAWVAKKIFLASSLELDELQAQPWSRLPETVYWVERVCVYWVEHVCQNKMKWCLCYALIAILAEITFTASSYWCWIYSLIWGWYHLPYWLHMQSTTLPFRGYKERLSSNSVLSCWASLWLHSWTCPKHFEQAFWRIPITVFSSRYQNTKSWKTDNT
jgi:hypothetical protein